MRRFRWAQIAGLLALFAPGVSACGTLFPPPQDFQVVSVQKLSLPSSNRAVTADLGNEPSTPEDAWVDVTIRTHSDLCAAMLGRRIYSEVGECRDVESGYALGPRIVGLDDVYDGLGGLSRNHKQADTRAPGGGYLYHLYFATNPSFGTYPYDICLQIVFHLLYPRDFSYSNVIRIPEDVVLGVAQGAPDGKKSQSGAGL